MITPQSNLDSVLLVMKFDGDIDLSKESHNLAYQISAEGEYELWFVSLNLPTSNVEAFVVADKMGNFTFFDDSTHSLIINNEVIRENLDPAVTDKVIDDYQIDGSSVLRPPKPGHILALYNTLIELDLDR